MKKTLLIFLCLLSVYAQAQQCGFETAHQRLMEKDPAYKARVEAMNAQIAASNNGAPSLTTYSVPQGTVYEIPVVIHVVHTGGNVGTVYNPNDATIQATLDYVNEAFAATYSSYPNTSSGGVYFPIKFVLAQRDESCNSATGINRIDYSSSSAYVNNGVNVANSNGVDELTLKDLSRWNNRAYYNVWLVNEIDGFSGTVGGTSGIGGFAYFPGASGDYDGTIMLSSQFVAGNFVLPHELGHAFGLYHTFQGDGTGSTCPTNTNCSTQGDLVCDTEPHLRNLSVCPTGSTNTCTGNTIDDKVLKNIMNYSSCADRFTTGQQERFMATLLAYRSGLVSSMGGMDTTHSVVAASCTTTTTSPNSSLQMGPIYVKLNDLENITAGTDVDNYGYHDYSCQMRANLIQGQTYSLEIASYLNAQKKRVYIDYNNDGAFDGTERIANISPVTYGSTSDTDWHTISYTVPSTGVTTCQPLRMRVISIWSSTSWPNNLGCGTYTFGQAEDYAVFIKPASAATTAVVSSHPICTAGRTIFEVETTGTFTSPAYQWYKNGSIVGTDSTIYYATGLVDGDEVQVKINYTDACYADSIFTDVYTVATQADTNVWIGTVSTSYSTNNNWSCGSVPDTTVSVIIDGSRMLKVPASVGTAYAKNLWVVDNATATYTTVLNVAGDITVEDSATLDLSAGSLQLYGTTHQTVNFGTTYDKEMTTKVLRLNNSAGATLAHGAIKISERYVPTIGTLTTNDKLTLLSDATQTAYIQEGSSSGGYISGNVIAEKYVPGKRAFRFVAHPFASSIGLSELTDDIDITGSGGSTNGFTSTVSNNPSAFWFDVAAADTSTAGNNPGWTAFTHTNGTSNNSWDRYELVRLFVRGSKGQGLTGGSYTPSAVTWNYSGVVNQGTQTITLAKGTNSEFVGCGNPFPSGIQMNTVARGSNVGANYYAWDATAGSAGAYLTNPWSISYVLPAYSAFFTTVTANTNNTITIEEADKAGNSNALFKGTAQEHWVELSIADTNVYWDRLMIGLDNTAMTVEDKMDGRKLYNPGLDFFTLSDDNIRMAVDVRPYSDGKSIPLGLTAYNRYNKYVIKTGQFDIPAGTKLYLHDKYLNKQEELTQGFEYWFDVTADSLSQGNNRFEINMVGNAADISEPIEEAQVFLAPNPATMEVKLSYQSIIGEAQVRLLNIEGKVIYQTTAASQTGSVIIPLHDVPAGVYIVEMKSDNTRFTKKLIKN